MVVWHWAGRGVKFKIQSVIVNRVTDNVVRLRVVNSLSQSSAPFTPKVPRRAHDQLRLGSRRLGEERRRGIDAHLGERLRRRRLWQLHLLPVQHPPQLGGRARAQQGELGCRRPGQSALPQKCCLLSTRIHDIKNESTLSNLTFIIIYDVETT